MTFTMMGQYVLVAEKPMTTGTHPAFTVTLEGVDEKVAEKEWERFMKDYSGKTKRDRKSGESLTTGAAIGGIGGNVNVHAHGVELGSNVQFTAWFESDDMFVSEDEAAQADVAVGMMERFIVHMKRVRIQNELDKEADQLKDLQKELNQEEKNEQRSEDSIEKYKQKIQEEEAAISESIAMQKQKTMEIKAQQVVIESVKNRLNNVSLDDEEEPKMKSKKLKKSKKNK